MQKEQEEQEIWNQERENKIDSKLQIVIIKQHNEFEAMKKTHNSGRLEIERCMNEEIDK